MVRITNIVCKANLAVQINLRDVAMHVINVRYNPRQFNGLIWQHRQIGGTCLLFRNGQMICNGSLTFQIARRRVRQYARRLQRMGFDVRLTSIQIVTRSAVYDLTTRINCASFSCHMRGTYEPEVMNAVMVKRQSVHFTCFSTGKIVITGIKGKQCLDNIVYPTLLEMGLAP